MRVFERFISPIYKSWKTEQSIKNKISKEKIWKDIGLRFSNFALQKSQKVAISKKLIFSLFHSLLNNLG